VTTLTQSAASDYLRLSLTSFEIGLIGATHLFARLDALRQLADPQDGAAAYASQLLQEREEDEIADERLPEETAAFWRSERTGPLKSQGPYIDPRESTIALKIVSGTLTGWVFHQGDDDFFPSVPHGHWQGKNQPKLDAYLGWIYRKTQQIDRIGRDAIIMLWNDRAFRDFARAAITYYLERHPHYSGWRVSDPLRLPRIRRGPKFR
jgi:hypothetical protein